MKNKSKAGGSPSASARGHENDEVRCAAIEASLTARVKIDVDDVTALFCGRPIEERKLRVLLRSCDDASDDAAEGVAVVPSF